MHWIDAGLLPRVLLCWAMGGSRIRADAVSHIAHMRLRHPWKYGKPLALGTEGLADSWGMLSTDLAAEPITACCMLLAWFGLGRRNLSCRSGTDLVVDSSLVEGMGRCWAQAPLPRFSQGPNRGIWWASGYWRGEVGTLAVGNGSMSGDRAAKVHFIGAGC